MVKRRPRKQNQNVKEGDQSVVSAESTKKIGKFAAKRWRNLLRTTSRWFLVPIELAEGSGIAQPATRWKRWIHYAVVFFYFIIMMNKLIVTLHRAFNVTLDLFTYMCACSFIVVFIPALATLSITCLPRQFCSVLNSWQSMLNAVEAKTGKKKSLFDDLVVSFQVTGIVVIVYSAAINTAFYSLVGDVPNCVLPVLKNAGVIETSPVLPLIVWRLLFMPLEILKLLPPMLVAGVVAMTMILGIGMFNLWGGVARSIKTSSMQSWQEVYTMYRTMQVYNAVLKTWLTMVSVLVPLGAFSGVILTLYVTIRPSNIPIIIYPCFPLVAVTTMTVFTGILVNAMVTKRKAAGIVGNLQMAVYSQYMRHFDVIERETCIRQLKSLRPLSIRIGQFAEPTLEVAMKVWENTFSLLLVLLSL